jgi:hypothetical protein
MKTRALLAFGLIVASLFSVVGCSSDSDNVKVEATTSQKVKDDGLSLRKSDPTGATSNSAKPSTD